MRLFDVLGPVMIGPSSSHTAGAARIGYTAQKLLGEIPVQADIGLYGSFATTGKGHGTDKALVAGLLGLGVDSGGKILDELRRGGRSYFSHAWRASEVVIASDSCARDSARVILVDSRCGLGCVLCCV